MKRLAVPILLLALCYALLLGYVASTYGELPARVASHFDLHGRANGWMSREACVGFSLGLAVLMPAVIVATMGGARRIPVSFINLPHRDYWLDPVRRDATTSVLLRYALWFASLNVLFVAALHWLMVQANLPGETPHGNDQHIALVAGGFLVGVLIWLGLLLRRFSHLH